MEQPDAGAPDGATTEEPGEEEAPADEAPPGEEEVPAEEAPNL
jgi:hypothetical protein